MSMGAKRTARAHGRVDGRDGTLIDNSSKLAMSEFVHMWIRMHIRKL